MTEKIKKQIEIDIENLEIKKLFKINENGNKVKVRRDTENAYSIYLNGQYVTTDETWQQAYELTLVLLETT